MTRQFLRFIIVCVIFLGTLLATLAQIDRRDFELRGYVDATKSLEIPFRIPLLGVNADLTQFDVAEIDAQLTRMSQAGIHWVRQEFKWELIEPQPGSFNWELYDPIIRALGNHPELQAVAVLTTSPGWARSADTTPTGPPIKVQDLTRFLEAYAARYSTTIDYYQIWDEPNISLGWGGARPNEIHYASMLKASYTVLHALDPGAVVLSGAFAPTTETGPQNINEVRYLENLYALGLAEYSDGIAAKPFGFSISPYDRTVDKSVLNFSRIILLREVMVANGDGRTALWASNWGWNNLPDEWHGPPSIWGQVDQATRIKYTLEALGRAEREWPWIGGMVLHHWNPTTLPDDPSWGFSMTTLEGEPNGLWQALVDRSETQESGATNGLYQADSRFASYSGVWAFGELGADVGWIQDSRVRFDFWGSDVAVLVREGDYVAYFYAKIDGVVPNVLVLPYDNEGNRFILLQSPERRPLLSIVSVARGLPLDFYQLELKAHELIPDEITNRWPLVGFAVSSGDLVAPFRREITVGWLTVVISLAALIYSIAQLNITLLNWLIQTLLNSLSRTSQVVLAQLASIALMLGMFFTWDTGIPIFFRREPAPILLSILTSGLIYINEWGIVVAVLAAIVLFIIVYHHNNVGLWLVIFWAPLFLFPVELYHFAFPVAEIVLLITLVAWSLKKLAQLRVKSRNHLKNFLNTNVAILFHPLDWVILLWVTLSVISLLWANHLDVAITDVRTLTLEPALFYLILRTTSKRADLHFFVNALLASGTLVAIVGIAMWLGGDGITAEGGSLRLTSVYGSPNNAALFLGKVIPFGLAMLLYPSTIWTRRLTALACILMAIAAFLTQSAGALLIGIPISIAVMTMFHAGRRSLSPLLMGIVVVFIAGFVLTANSERFERLTDFSTGTNFYRIRVWESTNQILSDHPITGVGMDQFLYIFRDVYMMPDAWQEPDLSHPHNIVLDWWVRLGLPGVLLLILLVFLFWKIALSARIRRHTLDYYILLGLIGSMSNLLSHGLVDNSVFVFDLALIFVLLLGIITTLSNNSAIDRETGKVL